MTKRKLLKAFITNNDNVVMNEVTNVSMHEICYNFSSIDVQQENQFKGQQSILANKIWRAGWLYRPALRRAVIPPFLKS